MPHTIDTDYMLDFLKGLLNTPSPTGLAEPAIAYCEQALTGFPVTTQRTNKGGLVATWGVVADSAPVALTAHVDTLGAMVKEIKSNGRIKLTKLGGYAWLKITLKDEGSRGICLKTMENIFLFFSPQHLRASLTG